MAIGASGGSSMGLPMTAMNLYWTAGLALFALLERTIPPGYRLASLSGLGLVAWGVGLLAAVT